MPGRRDGAARRVGAISKLTAYKPVTDERLANPEPENWLQYRGNYQGWGYSPLDQITSANIGRLTPMWSYSTGKLEGHQAPADRQ